MQLSNETLDLDELLKEVNELKKKVEVIDEVLTIFMENEEHEQTSDCKKARPWSAQ